MTYKTLIISVLNKKIFRGYFNDKKIIIKFTTINSFVIRYRRRKNIQKKEAVILNSHFVASHTDILEEIDK